MAWQTPQTIEIKMDAELTAYQGDDDLPFLATPQAAVEIRPGVRGRTVAAADHRGTSAIAMPQGPAPV